MNRKSKDKNEINYIKDEDTNNEKPKNFDYDYGGSAVAVMIIFGPLIMLAINISCSNQPCTFTNLPILTEYAKLESWFTSRSFILFTAYVIIQIIVSKTPYFGETLTYPGTDRTYSANDFFAIFSFIGIGMATEKFYYPISEIIYDDFIQMSIVASIYGVLLAIFLYVNGSRAAEENRNPYGRSGKIIYDFIIGTEINPTIFGFIHVKVFLVRNALIGVLLMNLTWLYRHVAVKNLLLIDISPTLLLFCGMQIVYILYSLKDGWFQMSSFEFQYEGCGYLFSFGNFTYPFFPTIITKRILDHDVVLSNELLIGTLVVFLIGLYIFNASNLQKNTFKNNPKDPKVAHLKSIPTLKDQKLLADGWWGFVRHPNYLGDLLIHIAWAVGCYNTIPVYIIITTFIFLTHRAYRVENRCSQRYGESWKNYCKLVPYSIIPYIY